MTSRVESDWHGCSFSLVWEVKFDDGCTWDRIYHLALACPLIGPEEKVKTAIAKKQLGFSTSDPVVCLQYTEAPANQPKSKLDNAHRAHLFNIVQTENMALEVEFEGFEAKGDVGALISNSPLVVRNVLASIGNVVSEPILWLFSEPSAKNIYETCNTLSGIGHPLVLEMFRQVINRSQSSGPETKRGCALALEALHQSYFRDLDSTWLPDTRTPASFLSLVKSICILDAAIGHLLLEKQFTFETTVGRSSATTPEHLPLLESLINLLKVNIILKLVLNTLPYCSQN